MTRKFLCGHRAGSTEEVFIRVDQVQQFKAGNPGETLILVDGEWYCVDLHFHMVMAAVLYEEP